MHVRAIAVAGHYRSREAFAGNGGHKLSGVVRRGIMLYLHTGQRGSDIVRLGFR